MLKKDKIKRYVPEYFKPNINVQWKALLEAHGEEDDIIVEQIGEAKKQIFVETAEKGYLDTLGDNVSVFRPLELNLADDKFRKLIEFLSFYPKQVRSLIANVLDTFYNETFSRFNLQTQNNATYNLSGGESLVFRKENDETVTVTKEFILDGGVDGFGTIRVSSTSGMYVGQQVQISDDNSQTIQANVTNLTNNIITTDKDTSGFTTTDNAIVFFDTYQYVVFQSSDFEVPGAATAEEVAEVINRTAVGIIAQSASSDTQVNIRTETVGLTGYIQVLGGTANDELNFSLLPGKNLKVEINEINPNELVIRIPSTIPALRRALIGCLHFHSDSSITANWPSAYIYDPSGAGYTVKNIYTTLNQNITAGSVYTQISVNDSSAFINEAGILMLSFGKEKIEYPVPYIGRPNNTTLLLDPSYVFLKDHVSGESINQILMASTVPRTNGQDYAVYNVGISAARDQVQDIVRSIVATGVVIRWVIDFPVCGK